jgi:hypothetical protein
MRERAFQDVTLEGAEVARALLEELEIPYLRPRHCSRKGNARSEAAEKGGNISQTETQKAKWGLEKIEIKHCLRLVQRFSSFWLNCYS